MKRFYLSVLLALFVMPNMVAQTLQSETTDLKWMSRIEGTWSQFLGEYEGMQLVLTNYSKTPSVVVNWNTSGIVLEGFGPDGKVLKELKINKVINSRVLVANRVGDTVYMVGYALGKKLEYYDLYRWAVDLKTWSTVGQPELLRTHKEKKMNDMDWKVARTPDGSVMALAVRERHEYVKFMNTWGKDPSENSYLLVLDSRCKPLWQRDDLEGYYSNMIMDSNEVCHVLLAGRGNGKTYFMFLNHSSYADDVMLDSVNRTDIERFRLLNWVNGNFVVGGLISCGEVMVDGMQYNALFALNYNERTGQKKVNTRPLSDAEINVLANREIAAATKRGKVNALNLKDGCATEWGGALQVWRTYIETTVSNGMSQRQWQLTGSLIAGIDTNADFRWVAPIRNRLTSIESDKELNQHLFYRNGKVYLAQTESARYAKNYDNSEMIKLLFLFEPSQLALYAIDEGGHVDKSVTELGKSFLLWGSLIEQKGEYMVVVGNNKGAKLVKLKGL
ncbi:MAG: hypothetical protein IJL38_03970 [Bacteroidales bacterium]|nr:hypothetical protein [Bacteroidales bacterium]